MTAAQQTAFPGIPAAPPPTPRGLGMGIDVARVSLKLLPFIRCAHCRIELAIDIVGSRHGEQPYRRLDGHWCKTTYRQREAAVAVVAAEYGGAR